MNKRELAQTEIRLVEAYGKTAATELDSAWNDQVMGSIRRLAAAAESNGVNALAPFRMMWKLSMASVAAAVMCVALYCYLPNSSSASSYNTVYSTSNYDCFESAVTAVAKL